MEKVIKQISALVALNYFGRRKNIKVNILENWMCGRPELVERVIAAVQDAAKYYNEL